MNGSAGTRLTAETAKNAKIRDDQDKLDLLIRKIIAAAIEVHRVLGPGLLGSAYEACLAFELVQLGLNGWLASAFSSSLQEC